MTEPDPAPDPAEWMRAQLQLFRELTDLMARTTELQPVLDWIAKAATELLRADSGAIKLGADDLTGPMTVSLSRFSTTSESGSWPYEYNVAVLGYIMSYGQHLASPDLSDDPRFPSLRHRQNNIRATLAVPLIVGSQYIGMLAVTHLAPGREWMPDDVAFLSHLANECAVVIERARLRDEEVRSRAIRREREAYERDLQQARAFQQSLVPGAPLEAGSWRVAGRLVAARHVGGDAFDYFVLGDGRLAISIADVMGKGLTAAFVMVQIQHFVRRLCTGRIPIPAAMQELNREVAEIATGRFVTMFLCEADPSGQVRYCNAGHNPPLLRRRNGDLETLCEGGFPSGMFDHSTYDVGETALTPGDALLLFSDGVVEAVDRRGEEFGNDRLENWWAARNDLQPAGVVADLMGELERFQAGATQADDITIVAVSREGLR